MVPPIRIERTTRGLGNRCSIQLSYGGMALLSHTYKGGVSYFGWNCHRICGASERGGHAVKMRRFGAALDP